MSYLFHQALGLKNDSIRTVDRCVDERVDHFLDAERGLHDDSGARQLHLGEAVGRRSPEVTRIDNRYVESSSDRGAGLL